MKTMRTFAMLASMAAATLFATAASASFHLWRMDELFSNADGSVQFLHNGKPIGLHVLPVQIVDRAGNAITPPGARWRLERSGGNWWLALRLDDRALPLPYTIDPSVSSVSFSGSPQTGGARSLWTVGFTSSTAGPT